MNFNKGLQSLSRRLQYLLKNFIKYGTRATRHIYFQSYHTC